MDNHIIDFYKQTSQFTYLGKYKEDAVDLWENKCKKDLKNLCNYLMNATLHRVVLQNGISGKADKVYGDFNFVNYTTPMSEDDIFLTASAIFAEIFRRDEKGFYIGRPIDKRLILTCRYVSVLTSAILKANGIPCRSRAGWSKYLKKDLCLDHWVNEYYNYEEKRWVRFDLDDFYDEEFMQSKHYKENGISKEYLDIGKNQFYTGAEAWLNYRKNNNFIENFQYGAFKGQAKDVLDYLFFDFMAINNFEVNYLFSPMVYDKGVENLTEAELKEIDNLAYLMLDVDKNFYKLRELYENTPKFRMLCSPLVCKKNFDVLLKNKGYNIDSIDRGKGI